MKLDRNIDENEGRGKYAIIKLRKLEECRSDKTFEAYTPQVTQALKVLEGVGALDWGTTGTESEFFLIRLKDLYARRALYEYANAALEDGDHEYANEIADMAARAGEKSPWCKRPD